MSAEGRLLLDVIVGAGVIGITWLLTGIVSEMWENGRPAREARAAARERERDRTQAARAEARSQRKEQRLARRAQHREQRAAKAPERRAWWSAALRWAWLLLVLVGVTGWLWSGRYEFDRQGGRVWRMDNWTGKVVMCRVVNRQYVCEADR